MSQTGADGRGTTIARVMTGDGVELHVEVEQPDRSTQHTMAEPTFVLSHGYTLDRRCWIYQRRALVAAGHRVVLWDQRGHGRSGKGSTGHYTIDRLGADLACVIGATVPDQPVVLVGHSMGGMAMMALAEHYPQVISDQVVAVAFIDSSGGQMHEVDWGLGRRGGDVINRLGPRATAALAPYQDRVARVLTTVPWLGRPAVAASSFGSRVPTPVTMLTAQMMLETDFEVTSAFAPTLTAHDKEQALSALEHLPALIMVGDRDVLTPMRHSDALAQAIPDAEYVVVRRAGHVMVVEHPELITDHLLDLLRRVSRVLGGQQQAPTGRRDRSLVTLHSTNLRRGRGRRALTVGIAS
ncbi:MAG: alpha/beta hydrolase [Ornithinimicrobium sp.]